MTNKLLSGIFFRAKWLPQRVTRFVIWAAKIECKGVWGWIGQLHKLWRFIQLRLDYVKNVGRYMMESITINYETANTWGTLVPPMSCTKQLVQKLLPQTTFQALLAAYARLSSIFFGKMNVYLWLLDSWRFFCGCVVVELKMGVGNLRCCAKVFTNGSDRRSRKWQVKLVVYVFMCFEPLLKNQKPGLT